MQGAHAVGRLGNGNGQLGGGIGDGSPIIRPGDDLSSALSYYFGRIKFDPN